MWPDVTRLGGGGERVKMPQAPKTVIHKRIPVEHPSVFTYSPLPLYRKTHAGGEGQQ